MGSADRPAFNRDTDATDVAAAFPDAIKGRTILITGVNKKGLGFSTAEAFASQSPKCLILAGRSAEKVDDCLDSLRSQYSHIDFRSLLADLSSQKSVKSAASEVLGWKDVDAIHLVINNAGLMRHGYPGESPVIINEDGIEQMFGINHIGHFLLTNLIMPKIIAAAKMSPKGTVRIVNLSSSGTHVSPFRHSDLTWQKSVSELPDDEKPNLAMLKISGLEVDEMTSYLPTIAYGQSKTCNVLFSVGLNQQLFDKYSILSFAVNPGEIRTELGRNTNEDWLANTLKIREKAGITHLWKTQSQGASTTLLAACDPNLGLPGANGDGQYLSDCSVGKAPAYATDKETAEKLWQVSEALTGQSFSF